MHRLATRDTQTESFVTRDAKQEKIDHPAENNEMAQADEELKEQGVEVALNADAEHKIYLSFFAAMFY
ncbi:MAG: hypothetical protein C0514_07970 [Candidatus Puniceispirillum sp.]|nr:hypothetical protein [Candidatus Puniceispirillum sp.]